MVREKGSDTVYFLATGGIGEREVKHYKPTLYRCQMLEDLIHHALLQSSQQYMSHREMTAALLTWNSFQGKKRLARQYGFIGDGGNNNITNPVNVGLEFNVLIADFSKPIRRIGLHPSWRINLAMLKHLAANDCEN